MADVAKALGISDQSIYTRRRQDRIDRGLEAGLTSAEKAELAGAKRPSGQAPHRRAGDRAAGHSPRAGTAARARDGAHKTVPPKAVRGGPGDDRRAHPGSGRPPGRGRVDLGLLRLAVAGRTYRGSHLLRAYRTHPRYGRLPLVLVTAGPLPEDLEGSGPTETVGAFADPRAVLAAVHRLLHRPDPVPALSARPAVPA